jgi:hypothetical protein
MLSDKDIYRTFALVGPLIVNTFDTVSLWGKFNHIIGNLAIVFLRLKVPVG